LQFTKKKKVNLNIKKGESYKSRHIEPPIIRDNDSIGSERVHGYMMDKKWKKGYSPYGINFDDEHRDNPYLKKLPRP
jgi:hypothetical protein